MLRVYFTALVLVAGLGFSGCSKKEAAEEGAAPPADAAAPAAPAEKPVAGKDVFPGAGEIRSSLAAKNYDQAVAQLVAAQAVLATPEQRAEWANIFQEVRDALLEASPTNPKAAEAMNSLRQIRSGR